MSRLSRCVLALLALLAMVLVSPGTGTAEETPAPVRGGVRR